jgi:hypothetical protein
MAAVPAPLLDEARHAGAATLAAVLPGGASTTVHLAAYDLDRTTVRVGVLGGAATLPDWCAREGIEEAIVGGFFARDTGEPLGELRTAGVRRRSIRFHQPWDRTRACVHVEGEVVRLVSRPELPAAPRGDLLQAGPLLVRDGRVVVRDGDDPEGFSSGQAQFDSDITRGRYPRAALGVGGGLAWAVACDGRSDSDAGMTLAELAEFMRGLSVETAINLDGGGSTSLVSGGRLVNRPRDNHGAPPHSGRRLGTALAFVPR